MTGGVARVTGEAWVHRYRWQLSLRAGVSPARTWQEFAPVYVKAADNRIASDGPSPPGKRSSEPRPSRRIRSNVTGGLWEPRSGPRWSPALGKGCPRACN